MCVTPPPLKKAESKACTVTSRKVACFSASAFVSVVAVIRKKRGNPSLSLSLSTVQYVGIVLAYSPDLLLRFLFVCFLPPLRCCAM